MSQNFADSQNIGRRYSKALSMSGATDIEINQFLEFADILLNEPLVKKRLKMLGSYTQRIEWFRSLTKQAGLAEKIQNFVSLIVSKNRYSEFKAIRDRIAKDYHTRLGREEVKLILSKPETEMKIAHLKNAIQEVIGAEPILETIINPDILGGYIVMTNYLVIDNSLRKRIETLQNTMKGVA